MSNGLEVFEVKSGFEMDKAKEVLEAKLNPSWIKQRQQGGTTLSYIGGHTVIRLLNKAFNYRWSFEIVSEEVKESLPKAAFDGWGKNKKPVMENVVVKEGDQWVTKQQQKMEPQPPVAKVLGRLTIPGIGVKEQYGSKVLIGGATEQESAFKSASTDALKKCASLFGVGLELYGDDEGFDDDVVVQPTQPSQVQAPQQQYQAPQQQPEQQAPQQQAPETKVQQDAPQEPAKQQQTQQQTASQSAPGQWNQDDINRLKELKAILGITNNTQLDPYVREFFDNPNVNFGNITPDNIKAVNIFLTKKAESL